MQRRVDFSMLAPSRTPGNVLYGPYTCNLDGSMLRWPVQAPTVVENERFEGDASLVGRQIFELVF